MHENSKYTVSRKYKCRLNWAITRIDVEIFVQYAELKLSESHEHPKYSQEKARSKTSISC